MSLILDHETAACNDTSSYLTKLQRTLTVHRFIGEPESLERDAGSHTVEHHLDLVGGAGNRWWSTVATETTQRNRDPLVCHNLYIIPVAWGTSSNAKC